MTIWLSLLLGIPLAIAFVYLLVRFGSTAHYKSKIDFMKTVIRLKSQVPQVSLEEELEINKVIKGE